MWELSKHKKVILRWNANTEPDLVGYNIYRVIWPSTNYTKINSLPITSTSYVDTNLTNGTTYCYRITAVDTFLYESPKTYEVCATPRPPYIAIYPHWGGNVGAITVTIRIVEKEPEITFQPGAVAKLTKEGQEDIVASTTTVITPTRIKATFDLTDRQPDAWDVVVINPDGEVFTLRNSFIIEKGRSKIWTGISGREAIRVGIVETYWITYGNNGNVNIEDNTFIKISIPTGTGIEVIRIETLDGKILFDRNTPEARFENPFIIWDMNDISVDEIRRLKLTVRVPSNVVIVPGWVWEWEEEGKERKERKERKEVIIIAVPALFKKGLVVKVIGGIVKDVVISSFVDVLIEKFSSYLIEKERPTLEKAAGLFIGSLKENVSMTLLMGGFRGFARYLVSKGKASEGLLKAIDHIEKGDTILGWILTALDMLLRFQEERRDEDQRGDNRRRRLRRPSEDEADKDIRPTRAWDPNEKVNPPGFGDKKYISKDTPLHYIIYYENDPKEATAGAQEVTITDVLSPTLDWETFSLEEINIGGKSITIPEGSKDFVTSVDLRPTINAIVEIDVGFDPTTGEIKWYFKGTDPATGELAEFLPPNKAEVAPLGEGYVTFTVKPKQDLPSGTEIRNKASIVFDVNPPIETAEVLNTIDATSPSSSISAFKSKDVGKEFIVKWAGTDEHSGIKNYTIYVSENGGPYRVWLTTTSTSATFHGKYGHTYKFYSVATDNVGNVEDKPQEADAMVTVRYRAPAEVKKVFNYPNPFSKDTTFRFVLSEHVQNIKIDIWTISGELIRTLYDFTYKGNIDGDEIYEVYFDGMNKYGRNLANGIYIYRAEIIDLTGEKKVITKKFGVIK